MKIMLQQDVRGQGKKGDVLNVSDGYARNYLFPRKLAIEVTDDVMSAIKKRDEAAQRRREQEAARAKVLANTLADVTVRLQMKSGAGGKLYGAVTSREIAEGLKSQHNIDIDHRKIVLDEPIKAYGTYEIKIKLFPQIVGTMYLLVTE